MHKLLLVHPIARIHLLLDRLHARGVVFGRAEHYLPDSWWVVSYVFNPTNTHERLLRPRRSDWTSELAPRSLRRPLSYMTG